MKSRIAVAASLALAASLGACNGSTGTDEDTGAGASPDTTHTHTDGTTHANHAPDVTGGGHGHDETPLGTITIGGMEIELAQGHGALAAGMQSHLVVKLPYSDNGATIVRAWIGSEDRTLSYVGKGEYARSHDDYDIHAPAPNPLPADAMWWIEIEKPDGTKHVGSARPIT